jgi:hypothetical protein
MYYLYMAKSMIKVIPKKRGRPATGNDAVRAVRLPDDLVKEIDRWAKRQGGKKTPTRSEAIRRLIEIGLSKA